MIIHDRLTLSCLLVVAHTVREPHEEHAHEQYTEGRESGPTARGGAIARRLATVHVRHVRVRDVGDGDGHFLVLWVGHDGVSGFIHERRRILLWVTRLLLDVGHGLLCGCHQHQGSLQS